MKIKTTSFIVILVIFTAISCKKSIPNCWQLVDNSGNEMGKVCGVTERQMQASYPPCNYYFDGDKYCWLVDNSLFIANKPEDFIDLFLKCYGHTSATKVACDYCQTWYTRQKNTYKPANTFTYSAIRVQKLCGDTVHTLYQGREIILRQTTDSLITLQFSNNGTF